MDCREDNYVLGWGIGPKMPGASSAAITAIIAPIEHTFCTGRIVALCLDRCLDHALCAVMLCIQICMTSYCVLQLACLVD